MIVELINCDTEAPFLLELEASSTAPALELPEGSSGTHALPRRTTEHIIASKVG